MAFTHLSRSFAAQKGPNACSSLESCARLLTVCKAAKDVLSVGRRHLQLKQSDSGIGEVSWLRTFASSESRGHDIASPSQRVSAS
jgi:hypothetical protein